MRQSRNLGFTLIEVMVTIAIVGVLSFLAIYMFQIYASKAKVATGVSELKSLAVRYDTLHISGNSAPSLADLGVNDSTRCRFSIESSDYDARIICELINVSGPLVGGVLTYQRPASGLWKCTANSILASDIIPVNCR